MGKTKLRSWEDEFDSLLNKLVEEKIGIKFDDFLHSVGFPTQKYKNLGSLEIFIPINRIYVKTINIDTYKWWKKYNSYDDCYYFFIRRLDSQPFFLDLIYLNYQTDMILISNNEIDEYFFEIYGSNHYHDFNLLYSIKANDFNINKKFHKFNKDSQYVYYILKLPISLINISNLLNISFFNTQNNDVLYTSDDIVNY